MKKNSVMVVTLTCLLLMMSEVQAAGQVGQMWINASGAGHDAFMKVMRKNGWTRGKGDEEQISNDVLSELMYTKSSKEGWLRLVDKELRTLDSYKTLVREEVPGMKGEWMYALFFVDKGQKSGFFVPGALDVPKQIKSMQSDLRVLKSLKTKGYGVTEEEIKSVQANLTALSAEVETLSQDSRILFSLVDETDQKVTDLTAQAIASKAARGSLAQTMDGLKGDYKVLRDELSGKVKTLTSEVKNVDGQYDLVIILILVVMFIIALTVTWLVRRLWLLKAKVADNSISSVDQSRNLISLTDKCKVDQSNTNSRFDKLEETIGAVTKLGVEFDPDNTPAELLATLSGGRENGVIWKCKWNGKLHSFEIWRDDDTPEGMVHVSLWLRKGDMEEIKDLFNPFKLEDKACLAVKTGRMKGHALDLLPRAAEASSNRAA